MWKDLGRIADHLTELRDANVPILWRPMHEFDGGWFWYGKGGSERFIRHDLTRKVVNGNQDLNGPQAPTQNRRGIDRPHMIRIPGANRAGFWLLLCFLSGGWGCGSVSRLWPMKDIADRGGRDEDV